VYAGFGVPSQLLLTAAAPKDETPPFVVITRDPSLWLSVYPSHTTTLIDVALILPKDWQTFSPSGLELEASVKRKLLTKGWLPEQIVEQYRPSRGDNPYRPDFGLLSTDGSLAAIVELKRVKHLLGEPLAQAIRTAKELGARFALLTNGSEINLYDQRIDLAVIRDTYPDHKESESGYWGSLGCCG
jgi:hypothetical protein